MRIDTAAIDQTRFQVREYNEGKHTLITRAPGFNYDYQPGEHHLRSLVVDTATGEVVSSGFPKFFNYGEDAETDRVFEQADVVWYTPKHDGTLIIVSPQEDGSTIIRTRGQYDLGEFEDRVMPLVPSVLISSAPWGRSYLFEYVGPKNRIVLPYTEERLEYLGLIRHADLSYCEHGHIRACEDLATLASEISEASMDEAGEGVVAHCMGPDGKVWLCKVKTKEYLTKHRLRFDMTDKKLRALTAYKQLPSLEDYRRYIEQDVGLDFECVDADVIHATRNRMIVAETTYRAFVAHCDKHSVHSRKGIATEAQSFAEDKGLQTYLMMGEFWHCGHEQDNEKARKALVAYGAQMTYRQVEALVGDLP